MVTWGVTDAGVPVVESRPSGDDDETVASHAHPARAEPSDQRLPDPSRVGTTQPVELPPITVEPTPEGLARAISAASAALPTTDPRRSHPGFRRQPPAMTLGDRTRVPDRVDTQTLDVGITVELPDSLEAVFVAAPLSYYLGADVRTAPDATPTLFVDDEPSHTFADLETDVARTLRRVFHLDCLLRTDPDVDERRDWGDLLGRLDLDADHLWSCSAATRLDRYLSAWDPCFDEHLPDWHLSTAVEPTLDRIECLPALLGNLSLIVRPDSDAGQPPELLDRTLSAAYRTRGSAGPNDVVTPVNRPGHAQAWLAPGRPVEAFKPTATAFEHRRHHRRDTGGPTTVAVVLGDRHMAADQDSVAAAYRERGDDTRVDTVASPTRTDLRDVLHAGYDVLHYVGHCDDAGLRCTDGHLSAADVESCRTPAFVLNACGSYDEGIALVERGAVAGAVTFADVLDRHAARVGTAMARLLADGFSVQRALDVARRRILMGQDYAAVGDATYAPWPGRQPPGILWIEAGDTDAVADKGSITGDERAPEIEGRAGLSDGVVGVDAEHFDVTFEVVTLRATGRRHSVPLDDRSILNGESVNTTLTCERLASTLRAGSFPVVWRGDLYWSEHVRTHFLP